jgi:Ni/Co efflux regulator RcnB
MKKYLVAAAALSLLGATSALAQDAGQQGQQRQRQGPQAQPQARQQGSQTRPDWNAYMRNNPDLERDYQQNRSRPGYTETEQQYAERHYREHGQAEGRTLPQGAVQPQGRAQPQPQGPVRPQGSADRGSQGRFRDQQQQYRDQQQQYRDQQQRYNDQQQQYRDRNDRNRYSSEPRWNGRTWEGRDYRRNWTARQRFRVSPYYRPRGWYYQRWTFGEILPQLFWGQNYWLDNYYAYGLPVPPPGTVWVRYGPDALLIDRYTGEIVQVVYNIFY